MSMNSKKSIAGTLVLILLGVLALFGGVKSLVILLPLAALVWYEASMLHGGRS